jgi:2'-5' RNA ligase
VHPGRSLHAVQALTRCFSCGQSSLSVHGFNFDQRQYKPHVTLLRNARWTDAALPQQMPQRQPVRWQIGGFALVQSAQQQGEPHYRVLARFPLG